MTSPVWNLLHHRGFMAVWWAGLISWIGNGALFIALPVAVYTRTDSTLATALSVMASTLATVLFGQLAGVFVDRWAYRTTLIWSNLALAGLTLAFLFTSLGPWWLILPVAFVQSAVSQFLGPAENALLPTLVDEHQLASANSLNALNNNLARLLGPALGGALMAVVGFEGVIVVDALTYALAAGLLLLVRPTVSTDGRVTPPQGTEHLRKEWRAGLQGIWNQGCVALTGVTAGLKQGWSELQTIPAATVNHVWNAVFWLFLRVAAVTLVRE